MNATEALVNRHQKIFPAKAEPVYVNVIMQKRRWNVRIISPQTGFACVEIAPSAKVLSEYLERKYPGENLKVDYSGLFEIF